MNAVSCFVYVSLLFRAVWCIIMIARAFHLQHTGFMQWHRDSKGVTASRGL